MKTNNHRVLIIDDERPVLMTLEALLKRHGYHVDTASTASQGLKLLRSKPSTLVLLDLQLPDADGLETLDQIKTEVPQTQAIILTAHDSMALCNESLNAALTILSASRTQLRSCSASWRKHWKNSSSCEKPKNFEKRLSNLSGGWRWRRRGPHSFSRANRCRKSTN